jgi:hypothetical protein
MINVSTILADVLVTRTLFVDGELLGYLCTYSGASAHIGCPWLEACVVIEYKFGLRC